MADNTTKILVDLDFDAIRSNIASYIANNSTFTDYNFEGSGLSFLMDVLAYNTHYNAFYLNMAINENFMDTAALRPSVVSLAKNLGYTPKSKKSALSVVSFKIPTTDPDGSTVTMDKTTKFVGSSDDVTYVFSPTTSHTAIAASGFYYFSDVTIREGVYLTLSYEVNNDISRYVINTLNIETDSLEVYVKSSIYSTETEYYSLISDLVSLNPTAPIFYLFETTDRKYEVRFGDGVLGKKPVAGNIVNMMFQTSNGDRANSISDFVLSGVLLSSASTSFTDSDIEFTSIENSYGGSEEEGVDSIRINALNNFRTQGRAVTADDYKFFLERDYPLADSISVWGGQDNKPYPIYGKVFISFKPKDGFYLTNTTKVQILDDIIKSKNILSVIPEIIDPDYTFLEIVAAVKYNSTKTLYSASELGMMIKSAIIDYNNFTLTKFGTRFNYSKFTTLIDDVDSSINGNLTKVLIKKNLTPTLNRSLNYTIDFQNELRRGTLYSKAGFYATNNSSLNYPSVELYLDDDSLGFVRVYKYSTSGDKQYLNTKAGTVDYINGIVVLSSFMPSSTMKLDNSIDLVVEPMEYDVSSERNNILTILENDIIVNMRAE